MSVDKWYELTATRRVLCNASIPSRRRSKARVLVGLALALVVPGGFVVALAAWLMRRGK